MHSSTTDIHCHHAACAIRLRSVVRNDTATSVRLTNKPPLQHCLCQVPRSPWQGKTGVKNGNKEGNLSGFKSKLVAYASCQAHSSVERAGLLADVTMRLLEPDKDLSLRGKTLAKVNANSLTLLKRAAATRRTQAYCVAGYARRDR